MAVGRSASVIGREFGLTGREMNQLLKQHGYLDGEPGAYGLTEKGERFGQEHYHENGYGGFAHRYWETRTWNDDLPEALKADMATTSRPVLFAEQPIGGDESDEADDCLCDTFVDFEDDGGDGVDFAELAILGAVVVATVLAVRYGPRLWKKVKHTAKPLTDQPEEQGSAGGDE